MPNCDVLKKQYISVKKDINVRMNIWRKIPKEKPEKLSYGKELSSLLNSGIKVEEKYNLCLQEVEKMQKLIATHFDLGNDYFSDSEWWKAIEQYKEIIELDPESYKAHYNIGSAFVNQWLLENALIFYEKSVSLAVSRAQVRESQKALRNVENTIEKEKKEHANVTDDPYSYMQHYLPIIRVPEAWKKVSFVEHVPVVAIIDDGVNINHPDLTENIWVDATAPYGSSKTRNFVGDGAPDNLPSSEHGTMIAGIIGASSNNRIGISGIAKKALIMPLRVFDVEGNARENNIVRAINYAIDKWATIINLSLGQSQFQYSTKYDEVLKKAYQKWIIVVIAAGNGDVLSFNSHGVNTTVNPLSPVCNNEGRQYSFGVGSINQKWARADWSNYGACVDFFMPGENIFSTSISLFNTEYSIDYWSKTGTSFSAPMLSGIIALGYNKYGKVHPDLVYQALHKSLQAYSSGTEVVRADLYLDTLGKILEDTQKPVIPNEPTVVTHDSLSSDVDFLIQKWMIQTEKSGDYHLQLFALRQEVIALAVKMHNIYLPKNYPCQGIFLDVSAFRPNTWTCRSVELALDAGIITNNGRFFRPEDTISVSETLSILMKAGNVKIDKYSGGGYEPWQNNVIGTALDHGIIEKKNFSWPNEKITRAEMFSMARRILEKWG